MNKQDTIRTWCELLADTPQLARELELNTLLDIQRVGKWVPAQERDEWVNEQIGIYEREIAAYTARHEGAGASLTLDGIDNLQGELS